MVVDMAYRSTICIPKSDAWRHSIISFLSTRAWVRLGFSHVEDRFNNIGGSDALYSLYFGSKRVYLLTIEQNLLNGFLLSRFSAEL
jgi:hypothetical protein